MKRYAGDVSPGTNIFFTWPETGSWLDNGDGAAQQKMFEKALALDKKYACGPERSGLCVRAESEFSKAFATMDRYVACCQGTEPT